MRPVFFRMLPTFESSLFYSTISLICAGTGLVGAFFTATGTAAAAAVALGAALGFGSSVDGCASGVGFTSGTGFEVLAALGSGGMSAVCVAFLWIET